MIGAGKRGKKDRVTKKSKREVHTEAEKDFHLALDSLKGSRG